MKEIWKDIEGYEGRYQVSNLGRVVSLAHTIPVYNPRTGKTTERFVKKTILKLKKTKFGYLRVTLSTNGRKEYHFVHRVVAKAFIDNPNNYPSINHRNEIKTDNRVENLEWCTHLYNSMYGTRNLRIKKNNRNKPVIKMSLDGQDIQRFDSVTDAAISVGKKNHITEISQVCKGLRHTAYGYRWRYADE